jgi:hypothetical protein
MMYVGMALPSSRSFAVAAGWFLSEQPARRIVRPARLFFKVMMPRARSRNALALGAIAAALVCAPGQAAARATLTTDARCSLPGAQLRMTASGLAPNAPLTVVLDGRQLNYGDGSQPRSDAAGSFAGSFATPALAADAAQLRHVLIVGDGRRKPRARFTVTRPAGADFQPASGDPRTLRARFRVWGFGVRNAGGDPVWLHWVSPRGTVRRTAALGTTGGDCGALTTQPRRVFPFTPEAGRWLLVLDTHRGYRVHASGPRAKIPVHVRPLPQ